MSWEAFRLTSKSPSELMHVMSPGGVDNLVREMLMACWRSLPEEGHDMPAWRRRAAEEKSAGSTEDQNFKEMSGSPELINTQCPRAIHATVGPCRMSAALSAVVVRAAAARRRLVLPSIFAGLASARRD